VNNFVKLLAAWVFRLSLLAAALIFMAGLLFVAALLLALWLLRALWAKLTGQPVQPWVSRCTGPTCGSGLTEAQAQTPAGAKRRWM
jgi:hypothetical protein